MRSVPPRRRTLRQAQLRRLAVPRVQPSLHEAPGIDSVLSDALLGGGLPPAAAEEALGFAAVCYEDDGIAERYLAVANHLAPDHAAVLRGPYRPYFYKNRLQDALSVACRCLTKVAQDNGLDPDWRRARGRRRVQTATPAPRSLPMPTSRWRAGSASARRRSSGWRDLAAVLGAEYGGSRRGAEGLDHRRSADWPDRQDDTAEASYRRRHTRERSSIASASREQT